MPKPKQPIHESEVAPQLWYTGTDRELKGYALSDMGGDAKIGFGIIKLEPGCNTLPGHYHTQEEEHLYVLEGTGTLHLGEETHPLRKGSYVNFPPGQKAPHHVTSDADSVLTYIIVGERIKTDEVIYPNGK